jgi:hypothetical protein
MTDIHNEKAPSSPLKAPEKVGGAAEADPVAVSMAEVKSETTKKLNVLMRQLSEQKPIMDGRSTLTKRYTRIVCVVAIYW